MFYHSRLLCTAPEQCFTAHVIGAFNLAVSLTGYIKVDMIVFIMADPRLGLQKMNSRLLDLLCLTINDIFFCQSLSRKQLVLLSCGHK